MKVSLLTLIIAGFLFSNSTIQAQTYYTQEKPLPCLDKTFSVLVHIVRDSLGRTNVDETQIAEQMKRLDSLFSPICVKFAVCETRYIDNFQYDNIDDIEQWQNEVLIKYHEAYRINLFLVNSAFSNPDEGGYATPSGIQSVETGGIIVYKNNIRPPLTVMAHLMGHYFGLDHTFAGNRNELVNGLNCATAGDLICDTPADPYQIGTQVSDYMHPTEPCRFFSMLQDPDGAFYRPDVGNLMSYYSECRNCFSHQQYEKMAKTYEEAVDKMW